MLSSKSFLDDLSLSEILWLRLRLRCPLGYHTSPNYHLHLKYCRSSYLTFSELYRLTSDYLACKTRAVHQSLIVLEYPMRTVLSCVTLPIALW